MNTYRIYGKLIKDYRKAHGMTQDEFAKSIDSKIEASQISGWESGKHAPSFEYIIALEQLGIPIKDAINDANSIHSRHSNSESENKTQKYRLNDNKIDYPSNNDPQIIKILDENGKLVSYSMEQSLIKYLALDSVENLTFYKTKGNAMQPEISDGDIVALENVSNESFKKGGIYLLNSNVGLSLLKFGIFNGEFKFKSAYHEYPIHSLAIEKSWQVIKVITISTI